MGVEGGGGVAVMVVVWSFPQEELTVSTVEIKVFLFWSYGG